MVQQHGLAMTKSLGTFFRGFLWFPYGSPASFQLKIIGRNHIRSNSSPNGSVRCHTEAHIYHMATYSKLQVAHLETPSLSNFQAALENYAMALQNLQRSPDWSVFAKKTPPKKRLLRLVKPFFVFVGFVVDNIGR